MLRKLLDNIAGQLGYEPRYQLDAWIGCADTYKRLTYLYEKRWITACESARRERAWRKRLQRINGELAVESFLLRQRLDEPEPE